MDESRVLRPLGDRGVISLDLAFRMRQAVGFRNVLVHEYVSVDDGIVLARVKDHRDLADFVSAVSAWVIGRTA